MLLLVVSCDFCRSFRTAGPGCSKRPLAYRNPLTAPLLQEEPFRVAQLTHLKEEVFLAKGLP